MLKSMKLGCEPKTTVEMLCRILFPYETQIPEVPLVIQWEDGRYFCYEHQFVIEVVELGFMPNGNEYLGYILGWHGHMEDDVAQEKAICTLHGHMFSYEKNPSKVSKVVPV